MRDRHDLSDEEWALLEPLLPGRAPQRGGRWSDHRQVVNGVFWRARTGAPWRDVPSEYAPWQTLYERHRRWSADGTWAAVLDALRAGSDTTASSGSDGEWIVSVDSTIVRAHQDAAGARRDAPKDVPSERLLGALAGVVDQPPGHTGG